MNRRRLPRVVMCLVLSSASGAIAGQQVPPAARYYNPRFSADGARVIFESTRDIKVTVYSINVDGTDLRALTDSRQNDAQPAWSADGTMLTFTSDAPGVNKVFVMASTGRDRRQLTTGPKHDAAPAFSADGRFVAWAATTGRAEDWRDIGVAPADGNGRQRLITNGPGNDQAPVWISAARMVFVREFPPKADWRAMSPDDHAKRRASSEIMAINADGSGLATLTMNAAFDSDPSWAAGLKRVFFSSDRDGANALYSMQPDGSDARRMGDTSGSISPDGTRVTYSKVVAGRSGIFVRDLATGAERELVGGEKTM